MSSHGKVVTNKLNETWIDPDGLNGKNENLWVAPVDKPGEPILVDGNHLSISDLVLLSKGRNPIRLRKVRISSSLSVPLKKNINNRHDQDYLAMKNQIFREKCHYYRAFNKFVSRLPSYNLKKRTVNHKE